MHDIKLKKVMRYLTKMYAAAVVFFLITLSEAADKVSDFLLIFTPFYLNQYFFYPARIPNAKTSSTLTQSFDLNRGLL